MFNHRLAQLVTGLFGALMGQMGSGVFFTAAKSRTKTGQKF
jgi:hypothetical protein